jgi:hypothetical protein
VASSSGCVYTTTPLGTPEDRLFDEALLGTWWPTDSPSWLTLQGKVLIKRDGDRGYTYEYHKPDGVKTGKFHLLKIGDSYFFEEQVGEGKYFVLHLSLLGDELHYRPFDDDRVRAAVKAFPKVTTTSIHGGGMFAPSDYVFTGPRQDLRSLFFKEMALSESSGVLRGGCAGKVAEKGLASKTQRTYDGWLELRRELRGGAVKKGISLEGADPDLIALFEHFAATEKRVEELRQQLYLQGRGVTEAEPLLHAFSEGLQGRAFRPRTAFVQEREAWDEARRLRAVVEKSRESMTKRYGLAFP